MSSLSPAFSSPILHQKIYSGSNNYFNNVIRCCDDNAARFNLEGNESLANNFPEKNIVTNPSIVKKKPPPRPRRIILVRHGQSLGNVDDTVYTRVADPKVGLTPRGLAEAEGCGRQMREMIEKDGADDWKVYFYVSPYRRGNFQDKEQMKVEKAARVRYGRFFYRFPNGESAADVYDRITGFRETLRTDIDIGRFQPPGKQSPNMNLVLVSHGLTLRVFLMRWYKWTVEQFEGLHNMPNGSMLVMERGYGGRYSLLMHHSREELKEFGLTDEMLIDQEWQKIAKPGELNYDCPITGPSYFTHFLHNDSKN